MKGKYGIKTKAERGKRRKKRLSGSVKTKGEAEDLKSNEPNFDQSDREHFLIGMMKANFLKRLESSVESFEISMNRTIEKIKSLEKNIKEFQQLKTAADAEYLAAVFEPEEDEKRKKTKKM